LFPLLLLRTVVTRFFPCPELRGSEDALERVGTTHTASLAFGRNC